MAEGGDAGEQDFRAAGDSARVCQPGCAGRHSTQHHRVAAQVCGVLAPLPDLQYTLLIRRRSQQTQGILMKDIMHAANHQPQRVTLQIWKLSEATDVIRKVD